VRAIVVKGLMNKQVGFELAVSFQKVVPSQREREADVAKRQFSHPEREQPCTRMLA
jgi:FixJ family two-component response regulator